MPDISMCRNHLCKLKSTCYRYTAIPNPYRQSYSDFEYERDNCYYTMREEIDPKIFYRED